MFSWAILEFIHDMLFVLPVSVALTGLFVGIVFGLDIEPIKEWLCKED